MGQLLYILVILFFLRENVSPSISFADNALVRERFGSIWTMPFSPLVSFLVRGSHKDDSTFTWLLYLLLYPFFRVSVEYIRYKWRTLPSCHGRVLCVWGEENWWGWLHHPSWLYNTTAVNYSQYPSDIFNRIFYDFFRRYTLHRCISPK